MTKQLTIDDGEREGFGGEVETKIVANNTHTPSSVFHTNLFVSQKVLLVWIRQLLLMTPKQSLVTSTPL